MNAHAVRCPKCGAPPWTNCVYPDGTDVGAEISHSLRLVEVLFRAQGQVPSPEEIPVRDDDAFLGGWVS